MAMRSTGIGAASSEGGRTLPRTANDSTAFVLGWPEVVATGGWYIQVKVALSTLEAGGFE
jgi:hypothetical protein